MLPWIGQVPIIAGNRHLQAALDHTVDCIATASSDTNDFDPCVPSCIFTHTESVSISGTLPLSEAILQDAAWL